MVIFVTGNFAKRYISGRCTKHQEPVTRSVRIRSIRYQKEKLNVCKRQKKIIFRSVGFGWLVCRIKNVHQNRSKNTLVHANAVTRTHGSCSLQVMASWKHWIAPCKVIRIPEYWMPLTIRNRNPSSADKGCLLLDNLTQGELEEILPTVTARLTAGSVLNIWDVYK